MTVPHNIDGMIHCVHDRYRHCVAPKDPNIGADAHVTYMFISFRRLCSQATDLSAENHSCA